MAIERLDSLSNFSSVQRLRRQIEYPEVNGRVQNDTVLVNYEVLQVSNGNVLLWLQSVQPELKSASRGFGWIEPLTATASSAADPAKLRKFVENRVQASIFQNGAAGARR